MVATPQVPVDSTSAAGGLPVAEGFVLLDGFSGITQALAELGLDLRAALAHLGLASWTFEDPWCALPIAMVGQLLAYAVARTGCLHLGLLVGRRAALEGRGRVGLLVRNAPDVGTALRTYARYAHLRDRGSVPTLAASDGAASLGCEVYQPDVPAVAQIEDALLASSMNTLRALCGPAWRPTEVRFAHRAPEDARPFRRFFGAPLRFDADHPALVFPARWLGHRVAGADPALFRRLAREVAGIETRARSDLACDLRRVLRALLVAGDESVGAVANRLGIHRRTLNRRLAALGTSLHELREDARHQLARRLLQDTRMPAIEIAAALGYSDASAFTRAFRRWTGRPPNAWRSGRHTGGSR